MESELIQSEVIHGGPDALQGGVNRELSFIWLESEVNGNRVTEATGITAWIALIESEMGNTAPTPHKENLVTKALKIFNPKLSSTTQGKQTSKYVGQSESQ